MQAFYDQGNLDSVAHLYEAQCLLMIIGPRGERTETPLFRRAKGEIRAEIYSVAARAYLALDRPKEADPLIRTLFALRFDEPFDDYWLSVRNAKQYTYYTSPRWQVGVRGGLNATSAAPFNRFSIFDIGGGSTDKQYLPISEFLRDARFVGQQFAFSVEYALSKNISVNTQLAWLAMRYAYIDYFQWVNIQAGTVQSLDINNEHFSRHNFLNFPLLVKYRVVKYRWQPFVQAGAFYSNLVSATRTLNSIEFPAVKAGNQPAIPLFGQEQDTDKNLESRIVRGNFGLIAGGGITYALGPFRLGASLSYFYGLNNITRRENRFADPELTFGFHDVPDDLRLHNWELSFSIHLPINYKAYKNQ